MKKILFVDDEDNILQGLQRMLRSMRHEWQMAFAASGAEALEILSKESFDIIVSDMRMPGMTGAELLVQVSIRYPHMVRLILSGQSDQENILRSVGPTHQYLSKPCDTETLKNTVVRACKLRDLLSNDLLLELMSQMQTLPSLPSLYMEIVESLNKPETSTKEIGAIIARDIGMTAKILHLVNSAFFGLPRQVSGATQAVNMLGIDTMKALVLSSGVFAQFHAPKASTFSLDAVWRHSMCVAALARDIAREEGQERKLIEDTFTAGLLHDVGQLALAANLTSSYDEVLKTVKKGTKSLDEIERESFGVTHAEVGAYLIGLWGLPDPIVETIAFHHCPSNAHAVAFTPLTAVHVANVIAGEMHPERIVGSASALDEDYLTELGLRERVPKWRGLCMQAYAEGTK
jgi:HD-like signal output (HDOD) protein